MTATHALQSKQKAMKDTTFFYCFKRILTATRMEAADSSAGKNTEQTMLARHETLIEPYQSDQGSFQHTETLYDISLSLSKWFWYTSRWGDSCLFQSKNKIFSKYFYASSEIPSGYLD